MGRRAPASAVTLALALSVVLALVHVLGGRLRFLDALPRHRWLSFAGGLSVAYVFAHLLPEIASGQRALERELAGVDALAWLVALAGLVAFYGLERMAWASVPRGEEAGDAAGGPVFWLHIGAFALYNVLVGVLLQRRQGGLAELLLFAFAMALHLLVNDFGLRGHHRRRYDRVGRWVLAGAVVAGAVSGRVAPPGEALIALLTAVLGGGVVLNVLKEELPAERDSRFLPFAAGVAAYAALLQAV